MNKICANMHRFFHWAHHTPLELRNTGSISIQCDEVILNINSIAERTKVQDKKTMYIMNKLLLYSVGVDVMQHIALHVLSWVHVSQETSFALVCVFRSMNFCMTNKL